LFICSNMWTAFLHHHTQELQSYKNTSVYGPPCIKAQSTEVNKKRPVECDYQVMKNEPTRLTTLRLLPLITCLTQSIACWCVMRNDSHKEKI